jgi:formylglycine-generating enzyme required for sulfatase activity
MKRLLSVSSLIVWLLMTWGCTPAPDAPMPYIETGIDPESWAKIPAGEFLSGQHNHVLNLDYDYEIMLTDVTNDQYARFLNQALASAKLKIEEGQITGYYLGDEFHAHKHELEIPAGHYVIIPLNEPGLRLNFDNHTFYAVAGYENHPMVMVSWFGARAYCEFYGWRLPTENEWEKAGRGVDGRAYPWGDDIQRENANFYSSHDIFEKISNKAGDTTPVGFYNGDIYDGYVTLDSPSPYGLYDMAGNVWQWTADVYTSQHYRYMRGGSKENYEYNLRLWTRNNAAPTYFSPAVGFRCARTP